MGFHVCEYCRNATSSGDVTIKFTSGRTWQMPDMILHYVAEHRYRPDDEFIEDVLNHELVGGEHCQTKELGRKIGYLTGSHDTWEHPLEQGWFFMRLWQLMKRGDRLQHRSAIM